MERAGEAERGEEVGVAEDELRRAMYEVEPLPRGVGDGGRDLALVGLGRLEERVLRERRGDGVGVEVPAHLLVGVDPGN